MTLDPKALKRGLDDLRAHASRGPVSSREIFTLTDPLMDMIARSETAPSGQAPLEGVVKIEHDGFEGELIGRYVTREGKRGVVLQQVGTKVVHVYGEKWLSSALLPASAEPVAQYTADINNVGERWLQVTISGAGADKLTEEQIEAALSAASPPASGAVEAVTLDDAIEVLAQRAVKEGITRSSFAQSAEYFHDQASDELSAAPTEGG